MSTDVLLKSLSGVMATFKTSFERQQRILCEYILSEIKSIEFDSLCRVKNRGPSVARKFLAGTIPSSRNTRNFISRFLILWIKNFKILKHGS